MKIAIAGTGYVGLSNAVLLAQHNEVVALDIDPNKVEKLNRKVSPIEDAEIEEYLTHKPLNLRATLDKHAAYEGADFVIIANRMTDDIRDVAADLESAKRHALLKKHGFDVAVSSER